MVILDPNGMSFDAVCVFGPDFQLLFKSSSSYFDIRYQESMVIKPKHVQYEKGKPNLAKKQKILYCSHTFSVFHEKGDQHTGKK